jgi:hypothetical protein
MPAPSETRIRSMANQWMKQNPYYAAANLPVLRNHFHGELKRLKPNTAITKNLVNRALTNNWFKQYRWPLR